MKLQLAGISAGLVLTICLMFAATALAAPPGGPGHSGRYHKHVCARPSSPGVAQCHADIETDSAGTPLAGSGPGGGYIASEIRSAYNLGAASTTAGAGRTIAIVDAYDAPTAFADLSTYRSQTGLPPISSNCSVKTSTTPCFQKVNQSGQGSPLPAPNSGWAQEISLDVQMASAVCEKCNILLVEASSNSYANLGAAVDTAATFGPVAISNSYGGGEFSGETSYDHYYTHPGATITVSSGDSGTGAEYPATSPNVIAVGGTHLVSATGGSRAWSESAWSGAGSGCSAVEPRPSWQPVVDSLCGRRAEADVSAVADPNTGVSVYDSYQSTSSTNWYVFGGTSVAAPIVASVSALAGNGAGPGVPYAKASPSTIYDVTSGHNGRCKRDPKICTAGTGWDGPTGLGTPNGTGGF